jgi:hypothetical protein
MPDYIDDLSCHVEKNNARITFFAISSPINQANALYVVNDYTNIESLCTKFL